MRGTFIALIMLPLSACVTTPANPTAHAFPQSWIDGSDSNEPQLHVQRYDANTFVIRQSLKTNYEAPFMYLLFGQKQALLLDTGAGNVAVRPTIERLIEEWRQANRGRAIHLIVAHSHAHDDHTAGDAEFRGREDTRIVGTSPTDVAAFFGLEPWPERRAVLNLGDRNLDVIGTPGHENSHIMFFDRRTGILLSGDALYPGRLYYSRSDLPIYRASIRRATHALRGQKLRWIMGAHVELDQKGREIPGKLLVHANERHLELPPLALTRLLSVLDQISQQSPRTATGEFILNPY